MSNRATGELMFDSGADTQEFNTKETSEFDALEVKADEALQNVASGDYTADELISVLKAWKHSYEQQIDIPPTDQDLYSERQQWNEKATKYHKALIYSLGSNPSVIGITNSQKLQRISELVMDVEFEGRGELIEYLAFNISLTYDLVESAKPRYLDNIPRPFMLEVTAALEDEKQILLPIMQKGITALAHENNKHSLRRTLEYLNDTELKEFSDQILLSPDLDETSRLNFAVEYINVHGFIPAIEVISPEASQNTALRTLYEKLQGSKVEKVMKDLWQVYQEYEKTADFAEYYEDEITLRDVSVVETAAEGVLSTFGKTKAQMNVVSLAAGKGRMPIALAKRGFTNIVAIEPQHGYVEDMGKAAEKEQLTIKAVEKTWDVVTVEDLGFEITAKDFEAMNVDEEYFKAVGSEETAIKLIGERNLKGAELVESTGRNLPHANTPQKFFKALDTIREISKDGAICVIDLMDPYSGRYKKIIDELADNLVELGVEEQQAKITFEGPSNSLRFNRMTVTDEQMRAYCELLGFKVLTTATSKVGEGESEFNNVYYTLEVDPGFHPAILGWERTVELLRIVGLTDAGVDYNEMVDSWGMTIGQAILFSLESEKIRESNKAGNVRKLYVKRKGGKINMEGIRP